MGVGAQVVVEKMAWEFKDQQDETEARAPR